MFERYTEPARRVIFFARYEASKSGSSEITPEHLFLGLLREDAFTRDLLGASAASIRERVEAALPTPRQAVSTSVDLPVRYDLKRVLAYGAEESERLGEKTIRAPHLLLGLLRGKESLIARLLTEANITIEAARSQVPQPEESEIPAGSMHQSPAAHHVLLALLEDAGSPVAQFLNEHGVTVDSVRQRFGYSEINE